MSDQPHIEASVAFWTGATFGYYSGAGGEWDAEGCALSPDLWAAAVAYADGLTARQYPLWKPIGLRDAG